MLVSHGYQVPENDSILWSYATFDITLGQMVLPTSDGAGHERASPVFGYPNTTNTGDLLEPSCP